MVNQKLSSYRSDIVKYLQQFFSKIQGKYSHFPLDGDAIRKLMEMSIHGKMYRGSILMYVYDLLTDSQDSQSALIAASALELFETGVLIQDDVMDRDTIRRGLPALRSYFSQNASVAGSMRRHFGDSVAVCVGDIAYFLSYEMLNRIETSEAILRKINSNYSREMARLCLAQIEDMRLSTTDQTPTADEIIDMYIGKTARYTWILPLTVAAILAGADTSVARTLTEIGRLAGIIYQLVDDRIGVFGDEKSTGKSASGDIREGKKTLYWHLCRKGLNTFDKKIFDAIYGKPEVSNKDIQTVKRFIIESRAYDEVERRIHSYEKDIAEGIKTLSLSTGAKQKLQELITYINKRQK